MKRALVVDDDREVGRALARLLWERGYTAVTVAPSGESALWHIADGPAPSLIICDRDLGTGITGLEFWHMIPSELFHRTVFFTGEPELLKGVSVPVIEKPNFRALWAAVERIEEATC
jgi:CheY-like chemotaxis protein